MTTINVLRFARKALALRRRIVEARLQEQREAAIQYLQTRNIVNRHRREIAESRLAVMETVLRAQQLLPQESVDTVERIEERERRAVAQLTANANIRAAAESRLRSQAAHAALDRAAFIERMKGEVPEELHEQTLDDYDRRVYESTQDGIS